MAENHSFLHRFLNWNKKNTPETVDAEQYAEAFGQFKKLLLEQYQIRIQAKTAKRLPINLSAKSTQYSTDSEWANAFFRIKTIESEDIASEIDRILFTHDRLLLIGDPGVGKTTILLFAAINILMDGIRDQKLPLMLNLATWDNQSGFNEWYTKSIGHTYNLGAVFLEELLKRNDVVPFFDGLDEMSEDNREDCLQKMAAYFGDHRNRQLIISSRSDEYYEIESYAPVYAEIEVQPLTLAQIKASLLKNSVAYAADQALLNALDCDNYLAKAVGTPFYLNTASYLFGKSQRTWADFPFKARSIKGRQAELVEIFAKEQVPNHQDRKYLHFLAEKMDDWYFPVFELSELQPEWCRSRWWYRLTLVSICTLVIGFIGSLTFISVQISLLLGILVGLISVLRSSRIVTAEIQIWSWHSVLINWKRIFAFQLAVWLSLGLGIGLLASSYLGWPRALIFALAFSLMNSLSSTLIASGTMTGNMLYVSSPYERFLGTFRRYFWTILALPLEIIGSVFLSFAFVSEGSFWGNLGQSVQTISWMKFLPKFSMFVAFPFLLSQFPQHFSLRLILYLENKLPLRLVTFLDRQTDQHIFEDTRRILNGKKQRGATWRFRHKILQDYFAKMQA